MILDEMACFLQYLEHLQDYEFSHKNNKLLTMALYPWPDIDELMFGLFVLPQTMDTELWLSTLPKV